MGLFSTLSLSSSLSKETTTTVRSSSSSSSSSCLSLPTVVQLYGGGKGSIRPIQLLQSSSTSSCHYNIPSFAVLTYQTIPTVALMSTIVEMSQQQMKKSKEEGSSSSNKNINNKQRQDYMKRIEMAVPDLGVWNCCVSKSSAAPVSSNASAAITGDAAAAAPSVKSTFSLVDSLLSQTIPMTTCKTFCFTINLSNQAQVEPTLTRLQEALVRHLILVNSGSSSTTPMEGNVDDTIINNACTTSLFQLRSVQFGLAEFDEASTAATATAPDVMDHNVKVALLICAQLGSSHSQQASSSKDASSFAVPVVAATSNAAVDNYKYKQGQALLIYHLRRYAAALNANLCFVQAPLLSSSSSSALSPLEQYAVTLDSTTTTVNKVTTEKDSSSSTSTDPPALTYPQVGLIWRALAQGQVIWKDIKNILEMEETTTTSTTAAVQEQPATTATESSLSSPEQEEEKQIQDHHHDDSSSAHSLVYGPGNYQLDLIESVLLRHAHYPGHWDASRDSLWTIFPSPATESNKASTTTVTYNTNSSSSDEGWLTEIRDSIASTTTTSTSTAAMQTPDAKKKGDAANAVEQTPDAGATDFFKSLLG